LRDLAEDLGSAAALWEADVRDARLGNGLDPDLDRGRLATAVAMVRKNGRASFWAE
jgi:hypothetical protein